MEIRKVSPEDQRGPVSPEFIDLIEKYGGSKEFVAKLRGETPEPERRITVFNRIRNAVAKRRKKS